MADSEFYATFKGGMTTLGLPCPETLFGTMTAALATMQGIASAIKTYRHTARE
jgi:hypothetical protein